MTISLIAYGGTNEIGGNKFLLKLDNSSVFLDFGLSFDAEGRFFEEFLQPRSASKLHDLLKLSLLPRVNGIYRKDAMYPDGFKQLKDIKGRSLWETGLQSFEEAKEKGDWHPDGIFLSHAHLDHCGHVPYLGDIPLVCTETTETVLGTLTDIGNQSGFDDELLCQKKRYLTEYSGRAYFPGSLNVRSKDSVDRAVHTLGHKESHNIVDGTELTLFDVGHSIPGSAACLIESEDKQVVYTGDLRFHGRSGHNLGDELENLNPDLMLCEGTRIDQDEPDDEEKVQRDLVDIFEGTEGLAIIAFSWKDIERYETVRDAAKSAGRTPVFDPRLAYLKARLGDSVYDEGAKVFLERSDSMLYSAGDYTRSKHKAGEMDVSEWDSSDGIKDTTHLEKGVTAPELREDASNYVLHMDYYRIQNLIDIDPPDGSIFVRAHSEPFNIEMELSEDRLKNWLQHFGINKDNNYEPITIHASGHASGPEILDMIEKIGPKQLVPIHTNNPELFAKKAAGLVDEVTVLNAGNEYRF
ncbi:MAG: MBL fold metallo-hydrolase [Promethearchaeati archaeon]